ncbi:MAG: hypothetical protein FD177_1099 [Desulfovibrionaceae bacterium]|nr:MAG: hypothetical protein FD177_1099 [Desulfovibrionaceae bacterium]
MLAELVEYLLTSCPLPARKLGYLTEAVAIRARHRRCRAAWQSHLENSRAAIMEAAQASSGRKCALVLGSGALLDVPVEQLARMFERVVLADVVHPLAARWRVRRLYNVRCMTLDVTGTLAALAHGPGIPDSTPLALCDLLKREAPDLIVSANILSQLPLLPLRRLKASGLHAPLELEAFASRLLAEHVSLLEACPGTACLIADIRWHGTSGIENPLRGALLPPPVRTWTWNVAPRPEISRDHDVYHEVGFFLPARRNPENTA